MNALPQRAEPEVIPAQESVIDGQPSNVLHLAQFSTNLSPQAQDLVQFTLRMKKPRKQTVFDHKLEITKQFKEVFQLIGGIPRLALWADQNPSQFYALYSKLIPASIKAEINLPGDLTKEDLETISTTQLKAMLLEAIEEAKHEPPTA